MVKELQNGTQIKLIEGSIADYAKDNDDAGDPE